MSIRREVLAARSEMDARDAGGTLADKDEALLAPESQPQSLVDDYFVTLIKQVSGGSNFHA